MNRLFENVLPQVNRLLLCISLFPSCFFDVLYFWGKRYPIDMYPYSIIDCHLGVWVIFTSTKKKKEKAWSKSISLIDKPQTCINQGMYDTFCDLGWLFIAPFPWFSWKDRIDYIFVITLLWKAHVFSFLSTCLDDILTILLLCSWNSIF